MQDIRLRAGSAVFLSLVAFTGMTAAALVFVWWLVFCHPRRVLEKMRIAVPAIVLVAFFGIVLETTGGGGVSYSVRMTVIILIGAWVYTTYRQGDFLRLGTWLLGTGAGFDLGMVAEMGMQSLDTMVMDLRRVRQAFRVKGVHRGFRSIVPSGTILVRNALRRADEAAELLAVRGYAGGGSYCPSFETTQKDILAGIAALCMGIIAFVPVSEFFILYH